MAKVTFKGALHQDKTTYAVAGSHKQTILQLAKENRVPIDFGCQNGECGTCLVEVTTLDKSRPMGGPLTPRETAVLKGMGKITQEQIDQMLVDDLPPSKWRLACQMILRDEDILVEYPDDPT